MVFSIGNTTLKVEYFDLENKKMAKNYCDC